MKSYSCLIFDLDGTLIDSAADIAQSANYMLQHLGLPVLPESQIRDFIGDGMQQLLLRCLGQRQDQIDAAMQVFAPYYTEHCLEKTVPMAQTLEVLQHYKNKKLAVLTNKPFKMTQKILDHFNLSDYFFCVLGGDSLAHKKPHPQGLLKIIGQAGLSKDAALMIGDGNADILAAHAAGVDVCAILNGYRPQQELLDLNPQYQIHALNDLKLIVK